MVSGRKITDEEMGTITRSSRIPSDQIALRYLTLSLRKSYLELIEAKPASSKDLLSFTEKLLRVINETSPHTVAVITQGSFLREFISRVHKIEYRPEILVMYNSITITEQKVSRGIDSYRRNLGVIT